VGSWEDLVNVGDGITSGIEDVPSFLGNVLTGDVHGVVTDGRKLIGDVGDVLNGVGDLGVSIGKVSARYAGTVGRLADSPILSAAQLVIEAQKATTGSGNPEDGNGYRESARRLEECVETLSHADPHEDRWNGSAALAYQTANGDHRRLVSNVREADVDVARILALEADQVSRTRKTLDETSQYLYDYGLATAVVSFIPDANAAKMAADAAAASAALATTNAAMAILVTNSIENALNVRRRLTDYSTAADDTSGEAAGCGTFVKPSEDIGDHTRPTRLNPKKPYTVPSPEEPPEWGPPATPYG
jgi:hypothetical protein